MKQPLNLTVGALARFEPFNAFLTNLKDEAWKNVRAIVTTTFTSGKLKNVFLIVSPPALILLYEALLYYYFTI